MNANMMLTGKIGEKVIVNEDITKFFDQIKDISWTDNNIYKPAKICEVTPTFSDNRGNPHQGHFQSKLGFFDQYLIEDNSNHLNDFKTYKNEVEAKLTRVNDRINTQKNDFLQMIDGVDDSTKKPQILEGIKNNLSNIVNNSKLKDRIGHLVNAMENQGKSSGNTNTYNNQNPNQGNIPNNTNTNYGNQQGYMNQPQYSNQQNNMNQMGMPGYNQNTNMTNQNKNWGTYNNQPGNNNNNNPNYNFK